jgi:hypothetical protein
MPLSEPRGGDFINLMGPALGTRRLIPSSNAFILVGSDYRYILSSPLENGKMIITTNITTAGPIIGMETARTSKALVFTNLPAAVTSYTIPFAVDYASGSGFLFITDTPGNLLWRGSNFDPLTCTFANLAAPPSASRQLFSMANGQTVSINSGLNNQARISRDNGVSWTENVSFTINGNSDIDHANFLNPISNDGSTVGICSVTGIGITRDVSLGNAGLLGTLATGFIPFSAAFNHDGSILVFSEQGNGGTLYVSTDPNNFTAIPAADNPFMFVAGSLGYSIRNIRYCRPLRGWFLCGDSSTSGICAFMSESDFSIKQGIWFDGHLNVPTGGSGHHFSAVDRFGELVVVGADTFISNSISFGHGP